MSKNNADIRNHSNQIRRSMKSNSHLQKKKPRGWEHQVGLAVLLNRTPKNGEEILVVVAALGQRNERKSNFMGQVRTRQNAMRVKKIHETKKLSK